MILILLLFILLDFNIETSARTAPNSYANGTMALAGVSPGGLQTAVETVLITHAGQSSGSFNYSVITKLVLLNNSSLNTTDQSFIAGNLTRLYSLDLSGHVANFVADFQYIRTITEVVLPANAVLADSMFNGCDRLARVLFLGTNAPAMIGNAFYGSSAVAYVPDPNRGGYEYPEFLSRFSRVYVTVNPVFSTQPQSQTVVAGQDVGFTATANGSPEPTLQWQVSTGGGTWTDLEGQTGSTLRLGSVSPGQDRNQYRCVATSLAGEVISATATLTVGDIPNALSPSIITQPAGGTFVQGSNVTLSVTATVADSGRLSYQWFSNTADSTTGGTQIQGATSMSYSPPTSSVGTIYYYVVVTNTVTGGSVAKNASITSAAAGVTIVPLVNTQAPQIITQPEGRTVATGDPVTLFVTAMSGDNGSLSYQWFESGGDSKTGDSLINGATETLFTPPTDTLGVRYYYVVVTNTNGGVSGVPTATVASNVVPVEVINIPDVPQNLGVFVRDNNLVLTWEAPLDDGGSEITGYEIADNIITQWVGASGEYEHIFDDLFPGRVYTLKVRAVNAAGPGEESSLTATTPEREVIHVDAIYLSEENLHLMVGEYEQLTYYISPENADDPSVSWSSSDDSIAYVNSRGMVTGMAAGSAVITIITDDGIHADSCAVIVESAATRSPLIFIGFVALILLLISIVIIVGVRLRRRRSS